MSKTEYLRSFEKLYKILLTCRLCFFRTITKTHIPKRHHDFENPIEGKMFDNTQNRIYGEQQQQIMTTNNTEYGTAKFKADGIARAGRKT